VSERQSPLKRGKGGGRHKWHGQSAAAPVPSFCAPWGAEVGTKAQRPMECFCPYQGGRNAAWQPSVRRGQSGGDAVSAAALTGPLTAAQTGSTLATARARATAASHTAPPGGWQLRTRRGLPGGDAVSATAQTGPPTAALPARLPPTRPARQRSRAGDACPAWKGRRAPWYPYAYTAGRGASGPCGVRVARHARCGMLVSAPARRTSRPRA
jgi:hypothetical protein